MRRSEAEGVEDVVVLEPFRGRGLARALVCGAVEHLQMEGCDPIFVVADDKDTVKDLYSRLGFDEDRRTWSFWWPGPYCRQEVHGAHTTSRRPPPHARCGDQPGPRFGRRDSVLLHDGRGSA